MWTRTGESPSDLQCMLECNKMMVITWETPDLQFRLCNMHIPDTTYLCIILYYIATRIVSALCEKYIRIPIFNTSLPFYIFNCTFQNHSNGSFAIPIIPSICAHVHNSPTMFTCPRLVKCNYSKILCKVFIVHFRNNVFW